VECRYNTSISFRRYIDDLDLHLGLESNDGREALVYNVPLVCMMKNLHFVPAFKEQAADLGRLVW
jgi:hypothetical protein